MKKSVLQDENIRLTRLKNSSREMIYFILRDDFFYPIGRITGDAGSFIFLLPGKG